MIEDLPEIKCLPIPFCDLCGRQRAVKTTGRDRYGYPIKLLRCACGLYRNSHRPKDLMDFYGGHYRQLVSAYHQREINDQTIQGEQLEYAEWLHAFLWPRRYDEILDVGGSTGIVSQYLAQEWGAVTTVVDPCEAELNHVLGERILATAEDFEPGERTWDIALVCQTIEHLLSPVEVLRKLSRCAGALYVDAVDVETFGNKARACKIDHLWGFTDKTMRRTLGETGWQITASQKRNRHLVYLAVPI